MRAMTRRALALVLTLAMALSLCLAAQAAGPQVTVTLDPRGGTVSPTTVTVTYGAAYGPLPEPVRLEWRVPSVYRRSLSLPYVLPRLP